MAGPNDTVNPSTAAQRPPNAPPRGASSAGAFVDGRPAADVIANPVPGYDYSKHPEANAIYMGLYNRHLNGQGPAPDKAAFRPGVQGAQGPPNQVGVANPYASMRLPEPGKEYPASERFDIPSNWGQGYIEMGGKRTYAYSTPEQTAARQARDAAIRQQDWEKRQRGMMTDLHGAMMDMVHGANYGGGFSEDQRVAMAHALGQQLGGMMQADVGRHAADLQFGHDPTRSPEMQAARLAAMQAETQKTLAEAGAADPRRKIELIDEINKDPQRRQTALAMGGADPQVMAMLPPVPAQAPAGAPAINPGNLAQHLAQPTNAGMAQIFADAKADNLDLGEVIARAATMPGFADRSSPNRQMFDSWLKQQYTDPTKWQQQLFVPTNPDSAIPVLGRLPGVAASIMGQFFGPKAMPGTGTGLFWGGNHEQAQRRFDLIQKYGISPF